MKELFQDVCHIYSSTVVLSNKPCVSVSCGFYNIDLCLHLFEITHLIPYLCSACLMILTLESVLSDHDGNQSARNSSEGCWEREQYVIKQKCVPCTEFEKVLVSCLLQLCVTLGSCAIK